MNSYRLFPVLIMLTISIFLTSCVSYSIKKAEGYYETSQWEGDPLVTTVYGKIQGSTDRENTFSWKGIPYALPPVGQLRWKKPRRHWPWKNTLLAGRFGEQASQILAVVGGIVGSEDCLFLNIWRPQSTERGLPVYVFLHGGGNDIGSANAVTDYYGCGVAGKSNMVFVSLNYRLGIFGWFLHPALAEDKDPADDSGNYGTLDIVAALSWIRENITAFGGDPDRVTLAGHSSGGMNVLALLTSPLASGLFHRAVVESAYDLTVSRETALAFAEGMVARLLVRDRLAPDRNAAEKAASGMSKEELRKYLYSKSVKQLLEVQEHDFLGMTENPAIIADGYVLPEEGGKVFETGAWPNKVPLILGTNRDETKLFLYFTTQVDWKTDLYAFAAKYGSLRWKARCADELATRITSTRDAPSVYVYRFDWGCAERGKGPFPVEWTKRLGAFHTLEIPFFLGTDTILGILLTRDLFTGANRKSRENLSRVIMQYLAVFAATGNPNYRYSLQPVWKSWNPAADRTETMVFDAEGDRPVLKGEPGNLKIRDIERMMRNELKEPSFIEKVMQLSKLYLY
ncbi:MAG: carboxylesterase family protein [Spirochaetales bacterium]|nr:carboxylesterase family protein [Spirochaetales bacterium]